MTDFAALANEVTGYERTLDSIYHSLREEGHAYAWVAALQARDALSTLVEQLRDDQVSEMLRNALG